LYYLIFCIIIPAKWNNKNTIGAEYFLLMFQTSIDDMTRCEKLITLSCIEKIGPAIKLEKRSSGS